MKKKIVPIRGMHCASCEILIGEELKKIPQVTSVSVRHRKGEAEITYSGASLSDEAVDRAVKDAGYETGNAAPSTWFSRQLSDYTRFLYAIIIVSVFYLFLRASGIASFAIAKDAETSLLVVLMVGLVAGISTCMALVGGLVLGLSARHAERHPEATRMQKFRPHMFFNLGRIVGYAVFGGLVGLIGNAFQLSSQLLGGITIAVGAIMIFLGLKLVDMFPVLQNKTLALPSGIARRLGIKKEQKEYSHTAATIAGALTFFLPCGFTQSMQLYAMTTGSFTRGAVIMGLFALGTAPGLLGIGGLASIMKGRAAKMFFAVAGIIVILLGWYNMKVGSRLFQLEQSNEPTMSVVPSADTLAPQIIRAEYDEQNGLVPGDFTVTRGQPVRFDIYAKDNGRGCAAYIVIPGLSGKQQLLKAGKTLSFSFTPKKTGKYPITCGMGMITWGYITVQ